MTFEEFVSYFPKITKTAKGYMVKCPAHEDGSASLALARSNDGGVLVKCFAGCDAKAITGALGLTLKDLFAGSTTPERVVLPPSRVVFKEEPPKEKATIEKIYSYTDPLGRELYQALRLKPKSFRQRHMEGDKWVWTMDGVERVLYRLPEVIKSQQVWIVEGEKDADNLSALGFCATCNVGGAGKWLDGYTESLVGKEIILCGDNDDAGQKHIQIVFDSISIKVKSVRIVKMPSTVKDVSDYIPTFSNPQGAVDALKDLLSAAIPHIGGISLPVYSMADLEAGYRKQVSQSDTVSLDLSHWIEDFRHHIRPLIPGELALIIGDTGTGKTAILQNLAMNTKLKSLLFEMELPPELLFERFFAIKSNTPCRDIEEEFRNPEKFGEKAIMAQFPNIFICPESRLTLERLETLIIKSELKIGEKPVLVLIDYVQLMQGTGSRYEKTSNVAEGLRTVARSTRTIIVITSQIGRNSSEEIGLHSAKDSGALENSASLVIGATRDEKNAGLLRLKVLKSTKGGAGFEAVCKFQCDTMTIKRATPMDL